MSMLSALLLVALTVTVPPALSDGACTTNSECPSNYCCLLGPTRYATPNCMPVQQEGEQCRVHAETIATNLTYPDNHQVQVKDIHFILCPCADGLFCNPRNGICT